MVTEVFSGRCLYDEDSPKNHQLASMVDQLEASEPGSPQVKSPSRELATTLRNLKRLESMLKVLTTYSLMRKSSNNGQLFDNKAFYATDTSCFLLQCWMTYSLTRKSSNNGQLFDNKAFYATDTSCFLLQCSLFDEEEFQ
ncbi:hypothetical protein J6590_038070 [Homalodisca vitripennis]|nr:hypothetical protein J6590_038070 [Homalodisca vitripennis]